MREHATERRQQEAQHDRQICLQAAANNSQQRRNMERQQTSTRQHYLHEKGWSDTHTQLHQQLRVKNAMTNQSKQN